MLRTFFFVVLSCALTVAVANEQRAQTTQQVAHAAKDIGEPEKQIRKPRQQKTAAEQALQTTEQQIAELEKQVKALQQEQQKTTEELTFLQHEQNKLRSSREEQQQLIAIQARAAYQAGQQEPLRLLLNQQQPEKFSRNLTYYQYIGKARQAQINHFNETLRQLNTITEQITLQQNNLAEQQSSLLRKQDSLHELRKQRKEKVAALNQQQRKQSQSLKARQADQAELNRVLTTIEETLARQAKEAERQRLAQQRQEAKRLLDSAPPSSAGKQPQSPMVSTAITHQGGSFAKVRGQLPWPVNGRLIAHFGSASGDT